MTVKSAPFYWLVCDRCGETSTSDGDYRAWEDVESARLDALDADWDVEGGNHVCYGCQPHPPDWDDEHEQAFKADYVLDCDYCGSSIWEVFDDTDGRKSIRLKANVPRERLIALVKGRA